MPDLASVVINNFNYGRFLGAAIESALRQTHRPLEVIVVDDGSTDDSRAVIESYGGRVQPIFKENGGQGSALNAGYAASRGEVVLFLDADDVLLPTAIERAVSLMSMPEVAKVHWPMWQIDAEGRRNGARIPAVPLPEGDFREQALREGPGGTSPPTSGNAWSRAFLEQVMPMPADVYPLIADDYLLALAPAYGILRRIEEPQSLYRVHGRNLFWGAGFEGREQALEGAGEEQWRVLAAYARTRGLDLRPSAAEDALRERITTALAEIEAVTPRGELVLLVEDGQWGPEVALDERRRLPFPEHGGKAWGRPKHDDHAIAELERLRERDGAGFLFLAWPAFWWLDYYHGFASHLRERYACVITNERLVGFDLR